MEAVLYGNVYRKRYEEKAGKKAVEKEELAYDHPGDAAEALYKLTYEKKGCAKEYILESVVLYEGEAYGRTHYWKAEKNFNAAEAERFMRKWEGLGDKGIEAFIKPVTEFAGETIKGVECFEKGEEKKTKAFYEEYEAVVFNDGVKETLLEKEKGEGGLYYLTAKDIKSGKEEAFLFKKDFNFGSARVFLKQYRESQSRKAPAVGRKSAGR